VIEWIFHYPDVGWPSDAVVLRRLQRRVSAYIRVGRARRVKIGLTNHPAMRAAQHNLKKHRYWRMVVIYATRSRKNAGKMERWLIEHYGNRSDNLRKGGAGKYPKTAWKYVYVLLSWT
jgi:hypothetical protein